MIEGTWGGISVIGDRRHVAQSSLVIPMYKIMIVYMTYLPFWDCSSLVHFKIIINSIMIYYPWYTRFVSNNNTSPIYLSASLEPHIAYVPYLYEESQSVYVVKLWHMHSHDCFFDSPAHVPLPVMATACLSPWTTSCFAYVISHFSLLILLSVVAIVSWWAFWSDTNGSTLRVFGGNTLGSRWALWREYRFTMKWLLS